MSKISKHLENYNYRILKIERKKEQLGMLIITLIVLIGMIAILKYKGFFINDKVVLVTAIISVIISVFPFSIIHEYIHFFSYPRNSKRKVVFEWKGIQPLFYLKSDEILNKLNILFMLIMPSIILGVVPILISLFVNNILVMTFMSFFGFSSLAMSSSDIFYFTVLFTKMKKEEYFYQPDKNIYLIKK